MPDAPNSSGDGLPDGEPGDLPGLEPGIDGPAAEVVDQPAPTRPLGESVGLDPHGQIQSSAALWGDGMTPSEAQLDAWFRDTFGENEEGLGRNDYGDADRRLSEWTRQTDFQDKLGDFDWSPLWRDLTLEQKHFLFATYLTDEGRQKPEEPQPAPPPQQTQERRDFSRYLKLAVPLIAVVGIIGVGGFVLVGNDDTAPADSPAPTVASESPTSSGAAPEEQGAPVDTSPAGDAPQAAGPETTIPASLPALTITELSYEHGSHILTMTVAGEGQEMAESEDTKWYDPVFTVDTPDGTFVVDAKFSRGTFDGKVFDAGYSLIEDATIEADWVTPSILRVVVDNPQNDTGADGILVELTARIIEPDGSEKDYESSSVWSN